MRNTGTMGRYPLSVTSGGWEANTLAERPPSDDLDEWKAWLTRYQLGIHSRPTGKTTGDRRDADRIQHASISLPWQREETIRGFYQQNGHLPPPYRLPSDRRLIERALLRHELRGMPIFHTLDMHCALAKDVYAAEFAAISMATDDPDKIQIVSPQGAGLEGLCYTPLPQPSSLCAHAMLLGDEPAIIKDRSLDWRFAGMPFGPHPDHEKQREEGFGFYASVPLMLSAPDERRGEDVRVQVARLCVLDLEPRPNFTVADAERLQTISDMASDALERIWLARKAQKLSKTQSAMDAILSKRRDLIGRANSTEDDLEGDRLTTLIRFICQTLAEQCDADGAVCLDLSSSFGSASSSASRRPSSVSAVNSHLVSSTPASASDSLSWSGGVYANRNQRRLRSDTDLAELFQHQYAVVDKTMDKLDDGELTGTIRVVACSDTFQEGKLPRDDRDDRIRAVLESWKHDGTPVQFFSEWLQDQIAKQYPDETTSKEADPLGHILPATAGSYMLLPTRTLDGRVKYSLVVYWAGQHYAEDWERTFFAQCAVVIEDTCARSRAMRSERAKLDFLQHISHELRTPLHGVINLSDRVQSTVKTIALDTQGDELSRLAELNELASMCGGIAGLSEDLRKAVDDLIELSISLGSDTARQAAPTNELNDDNLATLIEELCSQEVWKAFGDISPASYAPWMLLDVDTVSAKLRDGQAYAALAKALRQFVSNAIRFTLPSDQSHEPVVQVKLRLSEDRSNLLLIVADNGEGMDMGLLGTFTQPFIKADQFRSGIGIGATIAQSVLTRVGATLEVASAKQQGTMITMRFPIASGTEVERTRTSFAPQSATVYGFDQDGQILPFISTALQDSAVSLLTAEQAQTGGGEKQSSTKLASGSRAQTTFLLFDPNVPDSEERLLGFCKTASADHRVVVVSRVPNLSDHVADVVSGQPERLRWIHCFANPLGPTGMTALKAFLNDGQSSDYVVEQSAAAASESPTRRRRSLFNPISAVTSPDQLLPSSSPSTAPSMVPVRSEFFVLVVEDNPLNMRLLSTCVRKAHCTVLEAVNGQEAVNCYREKRPAVVLLDINMPIMDGFEAARRMRDIDGHTSPDGQPYAARIIAITALSAPEHKRKGLQNGMDEWRTKPVNLRGLQADLARWKAERSADVRPA